MSSGCAERLREGQDVSDPIREVEGGMAMDAHDGAPYVDEIDRDSLAVVDIVRSRAGRGPLEASRGSGWQRSAIPRIWAVAVSRVAATPSIDGSAKTRTNALDE